MVWLLFLELVLKRVSSLFLKNTPVNFGPLVVYRLHVRACGHTPPGLRLVTASAPGLDLSHLTLTGTWHLGHHT